MKCIRYFFLYSCTLTRTRIKLTVSSVGLLIVNKSQAVRPIQVPVNRFMKTLICMELHRSLFSIRSNTSTVNVSCFTYILTCHMEFILCSWGKASYCFCVHISVVRLSLRAQIDECVRVYVREKETCLQIPVHGYTLRL